MFMTAFQKLLKSPHLLLGSLFLGLTLFLSGCTVSESDFAFYGESSSNRSDLSASKKAVRAAKKDEKQASAVVRKLEKAIKRNERRLKNKRLSKTASKKIAKSIRADKRSLRRAKWTARRAKRSLNRAVRKEARAQRSIVKAKQRQARLDKKRAQKLARKEIERTDQKPRRSRLFSFASGDSATKNIKDYRARTDGGFALAAIPVEQINKRLLRQEVRYRSRHKPGTIVVDPNARYLYLVQNNGRAMRYGIGVGKAGFEWEGTAHVGWKREWPTWTPPNEMVARRPDLEKWSIKNGGMPGGPKNPLGARALYLMQGGVDTLYRLHGTPEWKSIGTAASSGCIRLMNQDIIDLYNRVPNGAKVIVL